MNAPPFPANPSFGQYFGNWVWSGSRWVCTNTSGVRVVVQVFGASAPYTPSPGLITAVVETVGGGGGGGGSLNTGGGAGGGGGGGSGGYSRVALASGLVLGGVNVTIGQGGAGTVDPASPSGKSLPGTATSFGALCVASGGGGGQANNGGIGGIYQGDAGVPAAPGIGDVAAPGNPGFPGATYAAGAGAGAIQLVVGGTGGATLFGGAGQSALCPPGAALTGAAGTGWGAGGAGAAVNEVTNDAYGGAGGAGICIVTEYCWADAIDDGCGCGPGGARVAITGSPQGWQGHGFDND
jgi:hypothetical protein